MGNFFKLRPKNLKLSNLSEKWRIWYLGDADSESGVRSSKFQPQNPFWANLSLKISKYLGGAGILKELVPDLDLYFQNSNPKLTVTR